MNHYEAVKLMAVERYLLHDFTQETRDSFEAHAFQCQECAQELRAGAVFVHGARSVLRGMNSLEDTEAAGPETVPVRVDLRAFGRFRHRVRTFVVPALAASLVVIAYQNIATIPSLRSAASDPRLLPSTVLHLGVRGSEHTSVPADPRRGAVVLINLPQTPGIAAFTFDLRDAQDSLVWSQQIPVIASKMDDSTVSLFLPGPALREASYTLHVSGTDSQGHSASIERRILDIRF